VNDNYCQDTKVFDADGRDLSAGLGLCAKAVDVSLSWVTTCHPTSAAAWRQDAANYKVKDVRRKACVNDVLQCVQVARSVTS